MNGVLHDNVHVTGTSFNFFEQVILVSLLDQHKHLWVTGLLVTIRSCTLVIS